MWVLWGLDQLPSPSPPRSFFLTLSSNTKSLACFTCKAILFPSVFVSLFCRLCSKVEWPICFGACAEAEHPGMKAQSKKLLNSWTGSRRGGTPIVLPREPPVQCVPPPKVPLPTNTTLAWEMKPSPQMDFGGHLSKSHHQVSPTLGISEASDESLPYSYTPSNS